MEAQLVLPDTFDLMPAGADKDTLELPPFLTQRRERVMQGSERRKA